MSRTFHTPSFVPCLNGIALDSGKTLVGSVCWIAGGAVGGVGFDGLAIVGMLCLSIHLFWCIGCWIDGARMLAASGVAVVTFGAVGLIADGVLAGMAPLFAAAGAVMHMAPAWSQSATPFARVSR